MNEELEPGTRFDRLGVITSLIMRNLLALRGQSVFAVLTMAIGALGLSVTFFVGQGALTGLWQNLDRLCGRQAMLLPDPGPDLILLRHRPETSFTVDDLQQLRAQLPSGAVAAAGMTRRSVVLCGSTAHSLPVDALASECLKQPAFLPVAGRSLAPVNNLVGDGECLVTVSAAKRLGLKAPEGQTLLVEGRRFQVVGFAPDPPETDQRFSARVLLPYESASLWWGKPNCVEVIMLFWSNPEQFDEVRRVVRQTFDRCRAPGAYYFDSPQLRLAERRLIVSNTMLLCSVQALFTIAVAAVGIINVMLASVVQRSREYAIRLVCGAESRLLTATVLVESLVLSEISALIGIAAGTGVAGPICRLVAHYVPDASQLEPAWSWAAIWVPLVVCGLCGFAAGLLPARRAARIDILEVLRND